MTSGPAAAARRHRDRLVSWRYRAHAGPALGLTPTQLDYVATVNRRIADGDYTLEATSCPCGEHAGEAIAHTDRYGIDLTTVQCRACGTLRFDPYLAAGSVADFYTAYYQDMYDRAPDPAPYVERQKRYGRRVLEFLQRGALRNGVVAEVGCGAGGALSVLRDAGYAVYGCDYSARLIEFGQQQGLAKLVQGDIEALIQRMAADGPRADVVLLHHVFEHLSDPRAWLERAQALLAPGGMVLVAVPDCAEIHRYPSPGGDLRLFLHIAHKYNFTIAGLRALAGRAGLQAHLVDVPRSDQAPEIWVAFAHPDAALRMPLSSQVWQGSSSALFKRLRRFELAYLWRAAWRKLARSVRPAGRYTQTGG